MSRRVWVAKVGKLLWGALQDTCDLSHHSETVLEALRGRLETLPMRIMRRTICLLMRRHSLARKHMKAPKTLD